MIDELPQGWTTAFLSDIAHINPRHPRDLNDDLLVSFAPMPALSESRPDFNGLRERPLGEVRKGFTHFAEGDVLFAKITPCMENGKAAVATRLRNGLGCGTTELHVLRPLGGVEPIYIYHFIHQPSFRRAAEANFTGTAGQLRVPVAFVEKAEIPIPPLPEQRRIVAKLERLLGKVDACLGRLTRIPILLKRFRQSVLAAACSGRLTADWREENPNATVAVSIRAKANSIAEEIGLPPSWVSCRIGSLMRLKNGFAFRSADYVKNGVPLVRISNIQEGKVTLEESAKLPPDKANWDFSVEKGDLVVAMSGATTGKFGIYDGSERCLQNQRVGNIKILDSNEVLPGYRNIYLQSLKRRIEEEAYGGAQPNISPAKIEGLPFACPPLAEQQEIVRRVEALFALADQIEGRYAKGKGHVENLTQSILAKAFHGELVPQDPNDEPASRLFDRLRQQSRK